MLSHTNVADTVPARTVVIGAAGFVGGALMRRLKAANAPALGLTRKEINLTAPDAGETLAGLLKPTDAVVAVSARAPCKDVAMMIENMVIARALTDALATTPVAHVINISSDAVYADGPLPLKEDSPAAPTSMHGAMHLAREIAFISTVKAPLAILRPSLLYGTDDPHNGYGPNRFRRLANDGKEIVLFGEGEERRDHVLIEDVAEIIFRTLLRRSTGTLNIATGDVHSFRAIAEKVVAGSPRKVAIKGSPRSGPMPHDGLRTFDAAATRAAFPDFKYTPMADGLAKAQSQMTRT
jgi:nucleoside-diphosphate-sugar epimerase